MAGKEIINDEKEQRRIKKISLRKDADMNVCLNKGFKRKLWLSAAECSEKQEFHTKNDV